MRIIRWRLAIAGAVIAASLLAAWQLTHDRRGWTVSPRFVTVDRGSLVVLSSVWDRPFSSAANDLCVLTMPRAGVAKLGTRVDQAKTASLWGVFVPLWAPSLAGLALIAIGVRGRLAEGCCRRCGYSLAGIEGGCPECGATPQAATSAGSG